MTIHFTPAKSATGKIRLSRVLGHHEIRRRPSGPS
ncbi:hypothetical protein SAMN05444340_11696 [Citreimonas salinaria]|uniref:Uncharacterized protein n=1 Tax=Citreimonas salinaria TaxID=321339 RepID=A0A1H3MDU1_9RHOB|nr:hypothetical protein SAMN05444340_11696 [Citreimonas salinaria]